MPLIRSSDREGTSSDEDVFVDSENGAIKSGKTIDGSDDDSDGEHISEYEKLRLRNIDERNKLARSLGIDSAIDELKEVAPIKKRKSTTPHEKKIHHKIDYSVLPKREPSRRIRNLAAKTQEKIQNEVEEELGLEDEEEKDERLLGSMPMAIETKESEDLLKRLSEIKNGIEVDLDVKLDSCSITEFQKQLSSFRVTYEKKMTLRRIQSLEIHPTSSKSLIMAGSTDGYISLCDLDTDQLASFKPHRAPVNCITVSIHDPTKIFSTSHDGTFICGDLEMTLFSNIYATDFSERTRHLTWHDQVDNNTVLLSHGNGSVGVLDLRDPHAVKNWYPCFHRSARTVHHHPVQNNYFLVSSGAGCSCNVYDMRACSSNVAEPICEMNHKKGLTSAFFSSSGKQIVSTCNDDYVNIFTSPLEPKPMLKKAIAHNNFTGRWLSVFKAKWYPGRDDAFTIGSLMSPRRIQIYGVDGKLVNELKNPEIMSTITPVIAVHPTLPLVVGGNSSGKIYVFSS